jgi:hypothetical protein
VVEVPPAVVEVALVAAVPVHPLGPLQFQHTLRRSA